MRSFPSSARALALILLSIWFANVVCFRRTRGHWADAPCAPPCEARVSDMQMVQQLSRPGFERFAR
jgi:hypothetical protein